MKRDRLLIAICWLLIIFNLLGVVSAADGMSHVTKFASPFRLVRDYVFLFAMFVACVSGVLIMFGQNWGRRLFIASAIAILCVAIWPVGISSPVSLFSIAIYAGLSGILFHPAQNDYFLQPENRPKLRTVFAVWFFVLASIFLSFGEMAGFMNAISERDIIVKCVMICVAFGLGAIFLSISLMMEKIRSVSYHFGLALIAATCFTAFFALTLLAIGTTPETVPSLIKSWPSLLHADLYSGILFSAFIAGLGACLVLLPRRRERNSLAFFMLGALGVALIVFLSVDLFAKPVWIGCFSSNPDVTIQSCGSIIQADRTTGKNLGLAYRERGRAYKNEGLLNAALSDETKAIMLRPDDNIAYELRGILYVQKGLFDKAISDYAKAIAINKNDPFAFFDQGIAYEHLSLWSKAIDDYDQAARLAPLDPKIFVRRGIAYASIGNWKQSVADASKAIALDPNDDIAWNNRCYGRANAGDLRDALPDCNRAVELGSDYSNDYDSRGFVYLQMKQYNAAISDYTMALISDPNSADALYGRGLAEKAAGYGGDSAIDLVKAKAIDINVAQEFGH